MAVELAEVGVPDTVVSVPIGQAVRPVLVLEFFPDDTVQPGGRITLTHGGWNGEVVDFTHAAAVLYEAAAVFERAASTQPDVG